MKHPLSLNQQRVLSLFDSMSQVRTHDVVKKIKLPRPTAKQVLTKLTELGILEQKGRQRGSYYTLKQESQILDPSGRELVVVYSGLEAFKNMFSRLARQLKKGDPYWAFAFKDEYRNAEISKLLAGFHATICRKGVDDRIIASRTAEQRIRRNYIEAKKMKLRFSNLNLPVGTMVLKKTVINLVWSKRPMAIIIKAPELHARYRDFFLDAWRKAKSI